MTDEKIIVKETKALFWGQVIPIAIFFLCVLIDGILHNTKIILPVVLIMMLCAVIYIWIFIETSRVLIMDKEGCTVELFRRKRIYNWEEIKIKRVEKGCWYKDRGPRGGVFFSIYLAKKPIWLNPCLYCFYKDPFAYFYFYFPREIDMKEYPELYKKTFVNEELFLCKMKEWNVEVTIVDKS